MLSCAQEHGCPRHVIRMRAPLDGQIAKDSELMLVRYEVRLLLSHPNPTRSRPWSECRCSFTFCLIKKVLFSRVQVPATATICPTVVSV
jgi:hypothetical protein